MPRGARWSRTSRGAPWGEATDEDGTIHRLHRVTDPGALDAVHDALADAELLIADGHHRYETARVYADEIGGEGDHRYVLMCLVALEDEGLTVFPTHRLVQGTTPATQEALADVAARELRRSSRRRSRSWRRPRATARSSWATSTRTSSGRSASR